MDRILRHGLLVLAICVGLAHPAPDIGKMLREADLIPRILSTPPPKLCHVTYKVHGLLYPGDDMYFIESELQPDVTWEADPDTLYTLYLTGYTNWTFNIKYFDPKQEHSPIKIAHEFHQWIQINIPGNNVSAGQVLYPYISPANPAKEYVRNRYVFWIFEQRNRIKMPKPRWAPWYMFQEFSPTRKFVDKFNLTGPIAGNFFYSIF